MIKLQKNENTIIDDIIAWAENLKEKYKNLYDDDQKELQNLESVKLFIKNLNKLKMK